MIHNSSNLKIVVINFLTVSYEYNIGKQSINLKWEKKKKKGSFLKNINTYPSSPLIQHLINRTNAVENALDVAPQTISTHLPLIQMKDLKPKKP